MTVDYYFFERYQLIYNKGYQIFDTASSVVTTKVKGNGFVPISSKLTISDKTDSLNFFKYPSNLDKNYNFKILDTTGLFLFKQKI